VQAAAQGWPVDAQRFINACVPFGYVWLQLCWQVVSPLLQVE